MKAIAAAVLMIAMSAWGQSKPEPIDVPPIHEEYGELGTRWCDMGSCIWQPYDPKGYHFEGEPKPTRRTRITCADKTRFLMTSEDGKQHCILLIAKESQ